MRKKIADWRYALLRIKKDLDGLSKDEIQLVDLAAAYLLSKNYLDIFYKLERNGVPISLVNEVSNEYKEAMPFLPSSLLRRLVFKGYLRPSLRIIKAKRSTQYAAMAGL